jgi:hypothetical protein
LTDVARGVSIVTEERVVTTEPVTRPVQRQVVETVPERAVVDPAPAVVETVPAARTIVNADDPVANAFAASQLIQTIVWSVVVLVLLVVALWALHVYAHLF